MRIDISSVVLVVAVLSSSAGAYAQGRPGRYAPSRPTVSPYLNLLRQNAGPVPNYYSFVRPQQQQRAINEQQQATNLQQQSVLQTQQRGLQQVQQGLLEIRQPQVGPTGIGGAFMNYGHFYNFSGPSAVRR